MTSVEVLKKSKTFFTVNDLQVIKHMKVTGDVVEHQDFDAFFLKDSGSYLFVGSTDTMSVKASDIDSVQFFKNSTL